MSETKTKLAKVKVLLFDWDGVFHGGHKGDDRKTTFSEADSMGINMLRFGFWLQNGEMPFTAIISGENNPTAKFWAEREHLDATFSSVKNKVEILDLLKEKHGLYPDEIMFVFDDILDLSLAQKVAYRVMISRKASALFAHYCKGHNHYDYITQNDGANHGVREACEYVLNEMGLFEEAINKRIEFSGNYSTYNKQRLALNVKHDTLKNQ